MNGQIGISGCFGGGPTYERLDTAEEVSALVGELETEGGSTDTTETGQEYLLEIQKIGRLATEYARRLRLLTWAVVAIALYLVLKEAEG